MRCAIAIFIRPKLASLKLYSLGVRAIVRDVLIL